MWIQQFLDWDLGRIFRLPLSQQASAQPVELNNEIENLNLNPDENDVWTYIWGSPSFFSNKAYQSLRGTHPACPIFKCLWNSRAQHTHKFFFWLILRDRLNTRAMLRRRNMQLDSYHCVLCVENVDEDIMHIFFECPFSSACWTYLNVHCVPEKDLVHSKKKGKNDLVQLFSGKLLS